MRDLLGIRCKKAIFGLICIILFTTGLAWLFWMRFQAGDLYPPYSSLRCDPLGTRVLYESLRSTHVSGATRNFSPLGQVKPAAGDTFMVCGLSGAGGFLRAPMWQPLLDRIARDGSRLIIAFTPSHRYAERAPAAPQAARENPCDKRKARSGASRGADDDRSPQTGSSGSDRRRPAVTKSDRSTWAGVMAQLGVALQTVDAHGDAFTDTAQRTFQAHGELPVRIPWRAPLCFDLQDTVWQTVYTWENRPVIIQRSWGKGSVVMSSDSYLFSNEAMRRDRQTDLLAWMIRPSGRVIMDELHNGLVQQPGIAVLMRKYRLGGTAACLVVLVVFMIWRHTAVFAPRPADRRNDGQEGIGPSVDGWTGLMRQHISPQDLLCTGHQAWRSSAAAGRVSEERLLQVGHLVEASGADPRRYPPAAVYRSICELLAGGLRPAPRPQPVHRGKIDRDTR